MAALVNVVFNYNDSSSIGKAPLSVGSFTDKGVVTAVGDGVVTIGPSGDFYSHSLFMLYVHATGDAVGQPNWSSGVDCIKFSHASVYPGNNVFNKHAASGMYYSQGNSTILSKAI